MPGAWEIPDVDLHDVKLLVGIPHTELTTVSWALALRALDVPLGTCFFGPAHYRIDSNRNSIAAMAVEKGFTHVLWLDADTEPPPDAFRKLFAVGHPLVSGFYLRRHPPYNPCVWEDHHESDAIKPLAFPNLGELKDTVVDVDLFGFGCVLMDVQKTLVRLPPPWFVWTSDEVKPPQGVSEDFFFIRRVRRELGITPKLHLGVQCQHNGLMSIRAASDSNPIINSIR